MRNSPTALGLATPGASGCARSIRPRPPASARRTRTGCLPSTLGPHRPAGAAPCRGQLGAAHHPAGRLVLSAAIVNALERLDLAFPKFDRAPCEACAACARPSRRISLPAPGSAMLASGSAGRLGSSGRGSASACWQSQPIGNPDLAGHPGHQALALRGQASASQQQPQAGGPGVRPEWRDDRVLRHAAGSAGRTT